MVSKTGTLDKIQLLENISKLFHPCADDKEKGAPALSHARQKAHSDCSRLRAGLSYETRPIKIRGSLQEVRV